MGLKFGMNVLTFFCSALPFFMSRPLQASETLLSNDTPFNSTLQVKQSLNLRKKPPLRQDLAISKPFDKPKIANYSVAQNEELKTNANKRTEDQNASQNSAKKMVRNTRQDVSSDGMEHVPATKINKISEKFPNIDLIDETGRKVKFYDDLVKDHIVMVNFIFTKCQKFCPAETARLRRVQRALGDRMGNDIMFISISIDPQNDTPEVLNEYKKKFDIGHGWSFLTGKEEEIKDLRMKLGLLSKSLPEEKTDHSLDILVGNESTGKWMRRSSMDSPEVLAKLIGENLANWSQAVSTRVDFSKAPIRAYSGSKGEDLFRQKCLDCHSLGGGDGIGPDLINILDLREKDWLRNWIKNPDVMIAAKDPIATALVKKFNNIQMPNLGITDSEVEDILLFIEQKSKKTPKNKEVL